MYIYPLSVLNSGVIWASFFSFSELQFVILKNQECQYNILFSLYIAWQASNAQYLVCCVIVRTCITLLCTKMDNTIHKVQMACLLHCAPVSYYPMSHINFHSGRCTVTTSGHQTQTHTVLITAINTYMFLFPESISTWLTNGTTWLYSLENSSWCGRDWSKLSKWLATLGTWR